MQKDEFYAAAEWLGVLQPETLMDLAISVRLSPQITYPVVNIANKTGTLADERRP